MKIAEFYARLRLVAPAAAVVLGAFVLLRSAVASPNTVYIEPAAVTADSGNTVNVDLVAEAPTQTLGAWTIDVRFDSKIVSTESSSCDPIDTPSGAFGIATCVVRDQDGDGAKETVTALGAMVFGNGQGLSGKLTLAAIAFQIAPFASGCTTLEVTVRDFADGEGNAVHPDVANGEVCTEVGGTVSSRQPESQAPVLSGAANESAAAASGSTSSLGAASPAFGTGPSGGTPSTTGDLGGTATVSRTPADVPLRGGDGGGDRALLLVIVFGVLVTAGSGVVYTWIRSRRRSKGNP